MIKKYTRSEFLQHLAAGSVGVGFGTSFLPGIGQPQDDQHVNPLFDWSPWERFRGEVQHPSLTIKNEDISFAKRNLQKFRWAKNYVENMERHVQSYLEYAQWNWVEQYIEETTPGDTLKTPCPACRDQGKPVHPHGLWHWDIRKADQLECTVCGTVFPQARYPEDIVLETTWGKPQQLTYCGAKPFVIFGFKQGRPSFLGNIRSQKVLWYATFCRSLAEVFILTQKDEYAIACRRILLRLATCYPNWLVHVGYGEYADMDPRIAAANIENLASAELTPPPNKPNHKLWKGYWAAGRSCGMGLECDFVRKVVEAYDLTCTSHDKHGRPIYSDEERQKIERDLLLESTLLLVSDPKINNKSISNRTAAALVGICVGHPGLVHFGLDGFHKTLHEEYLPDGTTSESPFYGLMTLGGVWDLAQASRGYCDPKEYEDVSGKRIDDLNLYRDPTFSKVWDAFFQGLQGDLTYPPSADSFRATALVPSYLELMVANYPARRDYLALLKEQCGSELEIPSGPISPEYYETEASDLRVKRLVLPYDLAKPHKLSSFSLYYRSPTLKDVPAPTLRFNDWIAEDLRIGHLRSGVYGREGLLTMNAGDWRASHHELDSLHLYYWKEGAEILSDLGYLWDHPLKYKTKRTLAHNTVVVDEQDQRSKGRIGQVHFFKTSEQVKVMEASSNAYDIAVYQRTSAIVDHGSGRSYVVDFFSVEGGHVQDYVFHLGLGKHQLNSAVDHSWEGQLYDFEKIRAIENDPVWSVTWKIGKEITGRAWSLSQPDELAYIAEGWGQRDWKNADIGTTIPYVLRRCKGNGARRFISVFEGFTSETSYVQRVQIDENGVLVIDTSEGRDYILHAAKAGDLSIEVAGRQHQWRGKFVAASVKKEDIAWSFAVGDE